MALPDYYNNVNADLLQLLPRGVRRIVESGCGAGALGEQFKRLSPETEYIGLELHPEAAALAATRLDRVVQGDIERLGPEALNIELGSVDCLVYGDVLEHLIDPWALVQRQVTWLREGGLVLACVPNVQHWTALVEVLCGHWPYQDKGLFDRTHLRFFTLEGIVGLFTAAGLTIHEVWSRVFQTGAQFQLYQELIRPLLQALNVDPAQYAERSGALQYVVRAIKSPEPVTATFSWP